MKVNLIGEKIKVMNTGSLKQGDIIKVSLDPTHGHEQAGYRPAIIVSNHLVQDNSHIWLCCPISHTNRKFPLYIDLPRYLSIDGKVLIDQVRPLDLSKREFKYVESLKENDLDRVLTYLKLMFDTD